jgi:uncharacterized protein (TIGR02145 family)/uncharacterized repeat protein (TIGR02543 family)
MLKFKVHPFYVVIASIFALVPLTGCGWDYVNDPDEPNGSLSDTRDGQNYRTVKIGDLTWMAENLNFTTTNNATDSSWCYDNGGSNCKKYGRLYNWDAAMKACPAGWRLPDLSDWGNLAQAAGGVYADLSGVGSWEEAGAKLKSREGWKGTQHGQVSNFDIPAAKSTDNYGFTALSGGSYYASGFGGAGYNGHWWSSTEYADYMQYFPHNAAFSLVMTGNSNGVHENREYKAAGMSVRCVYGEAVIPILTVSRSPAAGGTVTPANQTCITAGTRVTITAAPNDGYIFTGWTIAGTGSIANDGSASTFVTVKGNLTVTANFAQKGGSYTGKSVKIGNLTWMAENLNIAVNESWCYGDNADNCAKYGRLYTWDAAMKACPAGWHLPSRDEWNDLVEAAGGIYEAYTKLKSKTGWNSGGGTDELGFSALPGGSRHWRGGSSYDDAGEIGFWWSSTENWGGFAWSQFMRDDHAKVHDGSHMGSYGFSVRCVR